MSNRSLAVLWRVENPNTMQGLWYDGQGQYNGFIRQFGDALCHDLPMEFDPAFKTDGLDLFSACETTEDMRNWFNLADLRRLHGLGYGLYRFEVTQFYQIAGHAAFARDHIVSATPAEIQLICEEWTDD